MEQSAGNRGRRIVVCLDNPHHHTHLSGRPTNVSEHIRPAVERAGCDYKVVTNVLQADTLLGKEKADFLIIHHYRFTDVNFLRERHPHVKYVGTSSILIPEKDCKPNSPNMEFRREMAQHYDLLLDGWSQDVVDMLNEGRA